MVLNEYRCTRSDLYSHNCIGRDDLTARQGHYVVARSEEEALEEMRRRHPAERNFTVAIWKKNVYVPQFLRSSEVR